MTVATTTRSATFAGGQSALTFTFRTLVSNPEYILVSAVSGGTTVNLVYNVGYTVAVNSSGVGGTVTVSPTYSTAYTYVVYRQTGVIQSSAYSDYNQFPASTLENGLDRLTMINQENSDNATRAVTLPIGSSPSISTTLPLPVAGNVLGWNAGATALLNFIPNTNTYLAIPLTPAEKIDVITTDTDGSTVTFDLSVTNKHQVTLAASRIFALSNPSVGQVFAIRVVQGGSGSYTVTWFTTIKWAGGSAPTLTTTVGKADWLGFICTGTGTYDGFVIGQNL